MTSVPEKLQTVMIILIVLVMSILLTSSIYSNYTDCEDFCGQKSMSYVKYESRLFSPPQCICSTGIDLVYFQKIGSTFYRK